MIPILYRVDEIAFTSNGIGRLVDCESCIVTEERNGIYECEFTYPITGKFYNEMISNGGIISVIHDDTKDLQLFDIYAHTDPIDGLVTFNAHHVSYRLANVLLQPFEASSIADTFDRIPLNTLTNCPFTFWTDKITQGDFKLTHPSNVRAILAGSEGSVLDVYGSGDYEFDNFDVKLYADRGFDTGVTIRYGKNLADIENNVDTSSSYSAILPYWVGSDSTTIYGNIVYSDTFRSAKIPWTKETGEEMEDGNGDVIEFPYAIITAVDMDFTEYFEEPPTAEDLEQAAASFMQRNRTWEAYHNIDIDFVQLWQTPEYASVASLQRVSLCDLVSVYFPEMGITAVQEKVVRTEYNVLLERYDRMELGQAKTTLSDTLSGELNDLVQAQSNFLKSFVQTQTELITGGLGGYVVLTMNAQGKPQEILIMDTDDIETAVNVIRMNRNGIGFSTNGYAGPYESAWTIDGKFNADFIATGYLVANHIRGGTLSLGGYDDEYGVFELLNADGSVNFRYDRNGMRHQNTYEVSGDLLTQGTIIGNSVMESFVVYENNYGRQTIFDQGIVWFNYTNTPGTDYESTTFKPYGLLTVSESSGYIYVALTNMGGSYGSINPARVSVAQGISDSYIQLTATVTRTSGNFTCSGTKSREVKTDEYSNRLLYAYETPSPLFGDVGEAVLDNDGLCYVFLDAVFAETITTTQYQVFLQKYGQGDIWIAERKPGYFVVQGTPGLAFGWELKAKQRDYDELRLEKSDGLAPVIGNRYADDAADYYEQLMKERNAS